MLQSILIRNVLQIFFHEFGQSISFKKSSLMVSRNVNNGLTRTLSNTLVFF